MDKGTPIYGRRRLHKNTCLKGMIRDYEKIRIKGHERQVFVDTLERLVVTH